MKKSDIRNFGADRIFSGNPLSQPQYRRRLVRAEIVNTSDSDVHGATIITRAGFARVASEVALGRFRPGTSGEEIGLDRGNLVGRRPIIRIARRTSLGMGGGPTSEDVRVFRFSTLKSPGSGVKTRIR